MRLLCLAALVLAVTAQDDDVPTARGLAHARPLRVRGKEVRRMPPSLGALGALPTLSSLYSLPSPQAITADDLASAVGPLAQRLMSAPLAFGKQDGDDAKFAVPGVGTFGVGDVVRQTAKFTPVGTDHLPANGGSFPINERGLGYMDRESATGMTSGSKGMMHMAGIGKFEVDKSKERGTGMLDFGDKLMPFLQLPGLKTEPQEELTTADQRLAKYIYPEYGREAPATPTLAPPYGEEEQDVRAPPPPPSPEEDEKPGNPFDDIKTRRGYPQKGRAYASRTQERAEDSDLLSSDLHVADKKTEGFIEQGAGPEGAAPEGESSPFTAEAGIVPKKEKKVIATGPPVPIGELGLNTRQINELCRKFAPVAAKYCYGTKIEPQFMEKCRGYNNDCRQFQAEYKPLGAIANSFSSGVGLTYYDWGVNGIPFFPVNEEGGIGNGHNGKIDFGSWGGGYSDNLGVRDFYSQTGEYGANWYEGTYGYKTGWSIPVVQSMGVEGGGGTQVHVPLKEGDLGKPLQVTSGYHVGPYIGLADRVGVDWMNGGVSVNRGVAVPFVGVGVNTGTAIGFPSIGTFMGKMGMADGANNIGWGQSQGVSTQVLGSDVINAGSSSQSNMHVEGGGAGGGGGGGGEENFYARFLQQKLSQL